MDEEKKGRKFVDSAKYHIWCIMFFSTFVIGIIVAAILNATLHVKYGPTKVTEPPPMDWFENGIAYRIYIPSFSDSDGDGIGDFRGIRTVMLILVRVFMLQFSGIENHLVFLQELGVTILWLSPVQNTNTFSYDVVDFVGLKPLYGTLDHFRSLLNRAKSMGKYFFTNEGLFNGECVDSSKEWKS